MESSPVYQKLGTTMYNGSISPTDQESTGNVRGTDVAWAAVVGFFTVLIVKDAVKALRRSKHWIPGDFLVLSSFTIQLLNLFDNQDGPQDESQYNGIRLGKFWMNHTSRVMLSVLVAYLIPHMANPDSKEIWGKLAALVLVSFVQLISDLYRFTHNHSKSPTSNFSRLWPKQLGIGIRFYYLLATLFYSSIVILFLILVCSAIAGKGIERVVAYWTRVVLEEQVGEQNHCCNHPSIKEEAENAEEEYRNHHYCKYCWRRVEDALMRAWIVARAYSVEYVIARSALTSSAGILVTFQILITIVGGVWNSPKLMLTSMFETVSFTTTILQCVFILIGWFTITWRWATAVAYYRKWQSDSWWSCLRIEDFWTRYLRELQHLPATRPRVTRLHYFRIKGLVDKKKTNYIPPRMLWYPVIWLQWLVVFFCKACWLGSLMLFHNKLLGNLLSLILPNRELYAFEHYPIYKKMLDNVRMLGDSPESLWLANRKSIAKARDLIFLGKEDGELMCEDLVKLLISKRTPTGVGLSCLKPYKPQTGLKFLCRNSATRQPQEDNDVEKQQPLAIEEQFREVSTKSWKMTSVSLLSIIVHISPRAAKDCLNAYFQASEVMDFIERADTEADEVTSEAADTQFQALEKKVDKAQFRASEILHATPERLREALEELKRECKRKIKPYGSVDFAVKGEKEKSRSQSNRRTRAGDNDCLDREAAASAKAVHDLCDSIECNDETDVTDLLQELKSSLADIINECLERIQDVLFITSKKLAIDGDERTLVRALYTVGKASMILRKMGKT